MRSRALLAASCERVLYRDHGPGDAPVVAGQRIDDCAEIRAVHKTEREPQRRSFDRARIACKEVPRAQDRHEAIHEAQLGTREIRNAAHTVWITARDEPTLRAERELYRNVPRAIEPLRLKRGCAFMSPHAYLN